MDDVGNIPVNENLTWIEFENVIGGDAAIRAADPEIFRGLLRSHAQKKA